MSIIDTLKKKLKDIQESLSDNQGWVRQGRLTLEPIKEGIQQTIKQPEKTITSVLSFLPGGQVLNTPQVRSLAETYIKNWYVEPVKRMPESAIKFFSPKSTLQERVEGGLGLLGGIATFIPDPIQDVGVPLYQMVKGAKQYQLENQGKKIGLMEPLLKGGYPAFLGEKPVGLGEALTTNKTGQMIGNIAEFPLMIGVVSKLKKKQTSGLLKDVSRAVKEGKITVEEGEAILGTLKEKPTVKIKPKTSPLLSPTEELSGGGVVGKGLKEAKKDKFIEELEKIKEQIQAENTKPKTKPPPINPSELEQKAFQSSFKAENDEKGFVELINKWVGKRRAAEYKGIRQALDIEIPKGIDGREVIKKIENQNYKTTKDVENVAKQFRKIYDELYKEAKKTGIDMNYVKNYITHIWEEPIEEVAQKYQALSKKFKFSGERILPTYEEGIKMGLTPKYNNPQQILAEYIKNLEKVKANLEFFNALKEKGYISEKRIPGFVPIQAPGFPTKTVNLGERMVEGTYFAPKEIADKVNQILSPKSNFLDLPAKIFSIFQDIVMSGGLPKTPINAWTAAQIQKELAAGRIRSPIKALGIAMSDKATLDYFKKNLDYIIKMEEGGIPVRSTLNIGNLANKSLIEGFFGKNLGEAWHKFVNEPTFKRFMPILNIEFYKNTYESLIKNGVADDIARQKAAEATKNFYGIVSSGEALLRNKTLDNLFTIFFFAPRYRETLLRFFYNSIKGLKNPLAPKNINNTRFILGALIIYLGMNEINKLNTGKNMWENPKGLEDKMLIKTDDGYIGVPFFSGIFTVPRGIYRQTRRLIEGDYSGMAKDILQTYSSSLSKPIFDIFANSDYFGKPIYEEDDDTLTRHKKILSYLATQYTGHPYIKELFDPRNQNDPAYQRLSRALELPLRFYTQKSINARTYYEVRDNILKGLNKEERESFDYISLINKKTENPNDPNIRVLKYRIYYKYPKVFEARQAIELQMALKTNKPIDPLYLVDSDTARKYIVYESLPEASPERKAMIKAYPELSVLFEKRSEFFKNNPYYKEEEGTTKKQQAGLKYPEPSEYVKKQMEAKNWSDPEVQKYLEALRTYQNQQRLELGLLPVDEYGNIIGNNQLGYSKKKKKIKIGSAVKLKSIKIAMPKVRKIKITFPKTEAKVPDVFKTTKKKIKIKPKATQLAKKIASLV